MMKNQHMTPSPAERKILNLPLVMSLKKPSQTAFVRPYTLSGLTDSLSGMGIVLGVP